MKGCELRVERELQLALFAAWQTARLSHFNDGKLKPLAVEMKKLRPSAPLRRQTRAELLEAMRAHAALTKH